MTALPNLTADEVIALLDLAPLDGEGGMFRQTYVRTGDVSTTAILYLITPVSFSSLHRLTGDELFHVYLGDPCRMVTFRDGEGPAETILGGDIRAGQRVQHLVPAGTWQGTRLVEGGAWALLGTTMTPGFDPAGFELATDAQLDGRSPEVAALLRSYLPAALGES
ncbi:MAG: cupin domain-containing protein [Thermomicrobiales bacterium]